MERKGKKKEKKNILLSHLSWNWINHLHVTLSIHTSDNTLERWTLWTIAHELRWKINNINLSTFEQEDDGKCWESRKIIVMLINVVEFGTSNSLCVDEEITSYVGDVLLHPVVEIW